MSSKTFLSLTSSSSSTITHISLQYTREFHDSHLIAFSRRYFFPSLHTLRLGHWFDREYNSGEVPASIARILYAHPTIRKLCLWDNIATHFRVDVAWDANTFVYDYDSGLTSFNAARFLPNLQSLEAHPCVITRLARSCPSALRNLTELRFGTGLDCMAPRDLLDMRSALMEMGGLHTVKKLAYSLGRVMFQHLHEFSPLMEDLGEICPLIERFEADLPNKMTTVSLRFFSTPSSSYSLVLTVGSSLGCYCKIYFHTRDLPAILGYI